MEKPKARSRGRVRRKKGDGRGRKAVRRSIAVAVIVRRCCVSIVYLSRRQWVVNGEQSACQQFVSCVDLRPAVYVRCDVERSLGGSQCSLAETILTPEIASAGRDKAWRVA